MVFLLKKLSLNLMSNLILISTSLTAILALTLGFFSLIKNPKSLVVRSWFWFSLAIVVWCAGYIGTILAINEIGALHSLRFVYIGAALIPVLFFNFVINFLNVNKKYQTIFAAGFVLAAVFIGLSVFSNYLIQGVKFHGNFGYFEDVNNYGFIPFLIYFFFLTFWAVYLLIINFNSSDGIKRKQTGYIILASVFGFIGGTTNFVMDLTGMFPYGQLVVWLYPVFITYGIFVDEIKIKIKF